MPLGFLRKMQRKGNSVACRFGTAATKPTPDEEQILMTFNFFDGNDCTAFVDTVKVLYGFFVEEYGVTKEEQEGRKKYVYVCVW